LDGSGIDVTLIQPFGRSGYMVANTYNWTEFEIAPGSQSLTVTTYGVDYYTASNIDPSAVPQIISQFVVNPKAFVPLNGVSISGPAGGTVNQAYSFTAVVNPGETTTPLTYTWEATGQPVSPVQTFSVSDTIDYTWTTTGTKTITVTTDNGATPVSDLHLIEISAASSGDNIFIPLVQKS
jgi:hypothetical protein